MNSLKVVNEGIEGLLIVTDLAVGMIVDINNHCTDWLSECQGDISDGILLTDDYILCHDRLEMLIINSDIDLLLSQPVLAPQVTRLLDLKLIDTAICSILNHRVENIDTAGR